MELMSTNIENYLKLEKHIIHVLLYLFVPNKEGGVRIWQDLIEVGMCMVHFLWQGGPGSALQSMVILKLWREIILEDMRPYIGPMCIGGKEG